MKKVILLVRVSTEQQSYNEQANDLIRKAKELSLPKRSRVSN